MDIFALNNMDLFFSVLTGTQVEINNTFVYLSTTDESLVTFLPINTLIETARTGLLSYHEAIFTPDVECPFETPTKSAESVGGLIKHVCRSLMSALKHRQTSAFIQTKIFVEQQAG